MSWHGTQDNTRNLLISTQEHQLNLHRLYVIKNIYKQNIMSICFKKILTIKKYLSFSIHIDKQQINQLILINTCLAASRMVANWDLSPHSATMLTVTACRNTWDSMRSSTPGGFFFAFKKFKFFCNKMNEKIMKFNTSYLLFIFTEVIFGFFVFFHCLIRIHITGCNFTIRVFYQANLWSVIHNQQ